LHYNSSKTTKDKTTSTTIVVLPDFKQTFTTKNTMAVSVNSISSTPLIFVS
jgi:hypothetical protein